MDLPLDYHLLAICSASCCGLPHLLLQTQQLSGIKEHYLLYEYQIIYLQDRIMISITCMLIISTIQSSIDKMVPKTSYFKLVDVFLLYSFNIVIVIMAIHTYMDMCIHRDEVSGMIVDTEKSRPTSRTHLNFYKTINLLLFKGVTKVEPMSETDGSETNSRVSSAKSIVSSMFAGSDDDIEEDTDAYARARKINYYGQVGL